MRNIGYISWYSLLTLWLMQKQHRRRFPKDVLTLFSEPEYWSDLFEALSCLKHSLFVKIISSLFSSWTEKMRMWFRWHSVFSRSPASSHVSLLSLWHSAGSHLCRLRGHARPSEEGSDRLCETVQRGGDTSNHDHRRQQGHSCGHLQTDRHFRRGGGRDGEGLHGSWVWWSPAGGPERGGETGEVLRPGGAGSQVQDRWIPAVVWWDHSHGEEQRWQH